MFDVPILFIIFNRLDTAQKVFDVIKMQKPKYLYLAADGPRRQKENERELCEKVRNSILSQINWECELKTLFRKENLGCGRSVSSAINWFFENVEEGIIIEDDCLPHPDFFRYTQELLEKYRTNDHIRAISGGCIEPTPKEKQPTASYYFSATFYIGGWATWKRAWKDYDYTLERWNKKDLDIFLYSLFETPNQKTYIKRLFWKTKHYYQTSGSRINTWDYQFAFSVWFSKSLAIIPYKNLISNIGFGSDSTHTTDKNSSGANLKLSPILPLQHPDRIEQNKERELHLFKIYDYHNFFYFHIRKQIRFWIEKFIYAVKKG